MQLNSFLTGISCNVWLTSANGRVATLVHSEIMKEMTCNRVPESTVSILKDLEQIRLFETKTTKILTSDQDPRHYFTLASPSLVTKAMSGFRSPYLFG